MSFIYMRINHGLRFVLLGAFFLSFPSLGEAAPVKVAATIFSVADIVKHVGGNQIEVSVLLPSGANPHNFEISPGMIKSLREVKIIFAVGSGFDDWLKPLENTLEDVKIIHLNTHIELIHQDPHYWLSLKNAEIMANDIYETLKTLPLDQAALKQNFETYLKQIRETDQALLKQLLPVAGKKIMPVHDAWRYFARDYQLELIGTLESSQHGEPRPKQMAKLASEVKKQGIKVLFTQSQAPQSIVRAFAQDQNLQVYTLNPIESDRGTNYLEAMRSNAEIVLEALSR